MYCKHCGQNIPDDSSFCAKCGKPLLECATVTTKENEDGKHKVTIFRESQAYLLNPPINIAVDGIKKMSIENGGTREMEIEHGKHTFEFSASMRSAKIEVDLYRDILITVKWSRITGAIEADIS